jgi:predicted nucleotidyltransferase component of viral defense system
MATLIDELRMTVDESISRGIRPDVIRIKLKEKLQLYVLDFIYNTPKYHHLIFYGGTCLRKCFGAGRMSEDIDFETSEGFEKQQFADDVSKHFRKHVSYPDLLAHHPGKKISRVELRFPVLNALGLSPIADEKLNLKVEVNFIGKKYPTETRIISEDRFSFVARHYDLPTLMAGKLLACLNRVWVRGRTGATVKGRDYFDLLWYMQQRILPNPERLADAPGHLTPNQVFENLAAKVKKIKAADLMLDLEPLFEDGRFIKEWVGHFYERFEQLYNQYQLLLQK